MLLYEMNTLMEVQLLVTDPLGTDSEGKGIRLIVMSVIMTTLKHNMNTVNSHEAKYPDEL